MRESEGAYAAEGIHLLDEALRAGVPIESVYAGPGAPQALLERAASVGVRVFALAPGVVERVADTVSPQPLITVLPRPRPTLDGLESASFVVVGLSVRDPGNAGTLVRTAAAAGADAVVFADSSVDPYNPKSVRATAGALFRMPVLEGGAEVVDVLGGWGLRRVASVVGGGDDYDQVDLTRRIALLVGNEAQGLSDSQLRTADERISIPMAGGAESLNLSAAAAVLCFEVARQRRHRHPVPDGSPGPGRAVRQSVVVTGEDS